MAVNFGSPDRSCVSTRYSRRFRKYPRKYTRETGRDRLSSHATPGFDATEPGARLQALNTALARITRNNISTVLYGGFHPFEQNLPA
jgi:hypothetical protein